MLHWLFLKTICSGFSEPQRVPSIVAGKFVHIFFAAVIFFGAVYGSERLKNLGADFLIGDDAHHYLESGSLG